MSLMTLGELYINVPLICSLLPGLWNAHTHKKKQLERGKSDGFVNLTWKFSM